MADMGERRVKSRYPLEMNVRYQTLGLEGSVGGVGQTVNMSSNGMLLACASRIPEGTRMKVFVEWPTLLDGTTPLQLITTGTVVRCTPIGVSLVFETYQFRTMSRARHSSTSHMLNLPAASYGDVQAEPISMCAKSS
jgi:hypothetical protein